MPARRQFAGRPCRRSDALTPFRGFRGQRGVTFAIHSFISRNPSVFPVHGRQCLEANNNAAAGEAQELTRNSKHRKAVGNEFLDTIRSWLFVWPSLYSRRDAPEQLTLRASVRHTDAALWNRRLA
jgi:hypothetical protein